MNCDLEIVSEKDEKDTNGINGSNGHADPELVQAVTKIQSKFREFVRRKSSVGTRNDSNGIVEWTETYNQTQ